MSTWMSHCEARESTNQVEGTQETGTLNNTVVMTSLGLGKDTFGNVFAELFDRAD
jgi:hypothetical protein